MGSPSSNSSWISPDDLLDDVLYRDEPLDASPLVDDYGHLQRPGLELLEDLLDALGLGYDQTLLIIDLMSKSSGCREQPETGP